MDIFCEHMVKKKKKASDVLVLAALIAGGLFLSLLLFYIAVLIANPIAFTVYLALLIVIWYGVYILITRQNIEYEMSLTNGELDIDAIYSKKRRVHLLSARVREFEICAPIDDEKFKKEFENVNNVKKIYTAHSFSKYADIYFADFYLNAEKVRLVFEPSKAMIKKIKVYNDKKVFIKE